MDELVSNFLDSFKLYMSDNSIVYTPDLDNIAIQSSTFKATLFIDEDCLKFQYQASNLSSVVLDSRVISTTLSSDKRVELFAKLCASDIKRRALGIVDMSEVVQSLLWGICRATSDMLNIYNITMYDSTLCWFDNLVKLSVTEDNGSYVLHLIRDNGVELGDTEINTDKKLILECAKYNKDCIYDALYYRKKLDYLTDFSKVVIQLKNFLISAGILFTVLKESKSRLNIEVRNQEDIIHFDLINKNNDYIFKIQNSEEFHLSELTDKSFDSTGGHILFNLCRSAIMHKCDINNITVDLYTLINVKNKLVSEIGFKKVSLIEMLDSMSYRYTFDSGCFWLNCTRNDTYLSGYVDSVHLPIKEASNEGKIHSFEAECIQKIRENEPLNRHINIFKGNLIKIFSTYTVKFTCSHDTVYNAVFTKGKEKHKFTFEFLGTEDMIITVLDNGKSYTLSKDLLTEDYKIDYANPIYEALLSTIKDIISYHLGAKSEGYNAVEFLKFTEDVLEDIPYTGLKFGLDYDSIATARVEFHISDFYFKGIACGQGEYGCMVFTEKNSFDMELENAKNSGMIDPYDITDDTDTMISWDALHGGDAKVVIRNFILKYVNPTMAQDTSDEFSIDNISNLRLIALKYNKRIVGYRIKGDGIPTMDISKEAAERHGVSKFNVTKMINLVESNETLVSNSEKKSGIVYQDISDNDSLIEEYFKKLK